MAARRGVSELVGAVILVAVFLASATAIVGLQERAARAAADALRSAGERASLLADPPIVRLVPGPGGRAQVEIVSGRPVNIEYIILVDSSGSKALRVGKRVLPGEPLRVDIGGCRPLRLVIVTSGGAALYYPREGGLLQCTAASDGRVYDPGGAGSLLVLPPAQALPLSRGSLSINLTVRGELGGQGPSGPLEVETEERVYTLYPGGRYVTIPLDSGLYLRVGVYTGDNATLLYVAPLAGEPGRVVAYKGSAEVSLYSRSSGSQAYSCSMIDDLPLPYPLAAYTRNGSVGGECLEYTGETVVNATGRAEVEGVGPIVAAVFLNPAPSPARVTVRLALETVEYTLEGGISLAAEPPVSVGLERPLPRVLRAGGYSRLFDAASAAVMLADPASPVVLVEEGGSNVTALHPAWPWSYGRLNLSSPLTLHVYNLRLVPATNLSFYLGGTARAGSVGGAEVYSVRLDLEEAPWPQQWAAPYLLRLEWLRGGASILLAPRGEPPMPAVGWLGGVGAAEDLSARWTPVYVSGLFGGEWGLYRVWLTATPRAYPEGPTGWDIAELSKGRQFILAWAYPGEDELPLSGERVRAAVAQILWGG